MLSFSHRIVAATALLPAIALALSAAGCGDLTTVAPLSTGVSPQAGVIAPCSPTIADAWTFSVKQGDQIIITVDTVDALNAADFELRGICGPTDFIFADDNFLCTFPPPSFSCPATTFTANTDADCVIDVSPALTGNDPATASCADPTRAQYDLFVDVAGEPAFITQIRANSNRVCVGGSNNARSCSDDIDCPSGSCQLAVSLRAEVKDVDAMQPIRD